MSPEPFDSRAEAPPAKRWEKGYGDENVLSFDSFRAPTEWSAIFAFGVFDIIWQLMSLSFLLMLIGIRCAFLNGQNRDRTAGLFCKNKNKLNKK